MCSDRIFPQYLISPDKKNYFKKKSLKKDSYQFFKKDPRILKGNQIICIFSDLTANSTCMKKGSVTSKLIFSFFLSGKFKTFRQRNLLQYAESHYCRSMPRGGGCYLSGLAGNASGPTGNRLGPAGRDVDKS
jgi:hypothetical protein